MSSRPHSSSSAFHIADSDNRRWRLSVGGACRGGRAGIGAGSSFDAKPEDPFFPAVCWRRDPTTRLVSLRSLSSPLLRVMFHVNQPVIYFLWGRKLGMEMGCSAPHETSAGAEWSAFWLLD